MASAAMRRLAKDLKNVERQRNPQVTVRPSSKSFLEWHFVLHHLPADSVYKDGYYHGKLIFPEQYPMAPPALYMLTPNGRLEINQRLCLSMTDFHPESWNPAWTVESILVGLMSFMVDGRDPQGLGVVHATADTRRRLASSSLEFNRGSQEFQELFPEFASSESSVGTEDVVVQILPDNEVGPQQPTSEEAGHGMGLASSAAPALATGDPAAAVDETQAPVAHSSTPAEATLADQCAVQEEATPAAREEEEVAPCALECWICYGDGSQEPLIQPCACRGSMSGVHASCVEAWINHHRANAPSGEVPKCAVCHEAYSGTQTRPGPVAFAIQVAGGCLKVVLELVFLFSISYMYGAGAEKPNPYPTWKRLLLILPALGVFLYTSLLLAFSLPLGRPPPKYCGRCFRILDAGRLASVAFTMVVCLAMGVVLCGEGRIEFLWFIPFCILSLLPLCSFACGMHLCELAKALLRLASGARLLLCFIVQHPRRLVDPADALLHLLVTYAIMPVCWFVTSSTPALVILALHGCVLCAGLVEKLFVKKMRWKECDGWWVLIPICAASTYNLLAYYVLTPDNVEGKTLVLVASLLWFSLVTILAVLVNRARGVRQYRDWQNRNGVFQLNRETPMNAAGGGGGGDVPPQTLGVPAPAEPV